MLFDVEGMTCATCAVRIERVLGRQEGVEAASVNLAGASAMVRIDDRVDVDALQGAVAALGYSITPHLGDRPRDIAERYQGDARAQWRLFGVAAGMTLPTVVLSMFGPDATWSLIAQGALVTPVVLWCGRQFHKMALSQARHGSANMDTLISLGSLAAYFYSVWALWNGEHVFFETAGVIVTLIILGRALEARAKGTASAAVHRLLESCLLLGLEERVVGERVRSAIAIERHRGLQGSVALLQIEVILDELREHGRCLDRHRTPPGWGQGLTPPGIVTAP